MGTPTLVFNFLRDLWSQRNWRWKGIVTKIVNVEWMHTNEGEKWRDQKNIFHEEVRDYDGGKGLGYDW